MIQNNLVGIPMIDRTALCGVPSATQTASGAAQATATLVASDINSFTSVVAGTGAIVPSQALPGDFYEISNWGANALLVYPAVGGIFNGLAANATVSVPINKTLQLRCVANLNWNTTLSA